MSYTKDPTGIGDIVLRTKYYFGMVGPAELGLQFNTSLPTGDQDNLQGVGSVRFDPRVIASAVNRLFATGRPRYRSTFEGEVARRVRPLSYEEASEVA